MERSRERVRIAVVDADEVARGGLMVLFSDDERFELAPAVSRPVLLPVVEGDAVVLVDPAPGGPFDASWLRQTRERAPEAKLVVYTTRFEAPDLLPALEMGLSGYLLKGRISEAGLARAVGEVAWDEVVVVHEEVRDLFRAEPGRLRLAPAPSPPRQLSPREREVLGLVAQGLFDEDIGGRLGTSPSTVGKQMHSAMEKLGARTREQAVLLGVRYGIIDPYAS